MKIIKLNKRQAITYLVLFLLSGGLALMMGYTRLLILLTSLLFLYPSTTTLLSRATNRPSIFLSTILTVICYTVVFQAILLFAWVINPEISLYGTLLITCLLSFSTFLAGVRFNWYTTTASTPSRFDRADLLAIIVSLIFIAGIIVPVLYRHHGERAPLVLSFINNGVDDSAHIAMLSDRMDFDHGIFQRTQFEDKVRVSGMYPAGWSSVNATFAQSLYPDMPSGKTYIKIYIALKLLWFAMFIFLITRASILSARHIRSRDLELYEATVVAVVSGAVGVVYAYDIFREGFFGFLPQLIAIPILIILLSNTERLKRHPIILPVSLFIGASLSLSWTIALPSVVLAIFALYYSIHKNDFFSFILDSVKRYVLIYTVFLAVIITQIVVMQTSKGSVGAASALLNPGGVAQYPTLFYAVLIAATILVVFKGSRAGTQHLSSILIAGTSGAFAVLIGVYQIAKTGSLQYYHYKMLYITIVALHPLVAVAAFIGYRKIRDAAQPLLGPAVGILVMVVFSLIFITPKTIEYVSGSRHLGPSLSEVVYSNIKETRSTSHVIYYLDGYFAVADTATMIDRANTQETKCSTSSHLEFIDSSNLTKSLSNVLRMCRGVDLTIIVFEKDVQKIKLLVKQNPSIRVIGV